MSARIDIMASMLHSVIRVRTTDSVFGGLRDIDLEFEFHRLLLALGSETNF